MKKLLRLFSFIFLLCSVAFILVLVGCMSTPPSKEVSSTNVPVDHPPEVTEVPSWITWLSAHWGADHKDWVEMANSNCNGDVQAWLSSSPLYGYSEKIWNHIEAARYIDPIIIPTDCSTLYKTLNREYLANTFSSQLMDELCRCDATRSFQITEYVIENVVTEEVSREDSAQKIWICYFFADFKFNGIISPIACGNTGAFTGAESFGSYEMSLDDGSCVFYPIYSDNFQRVVQ